MTKSAKTYTVTFPKDARPGVQAIGTLRRGESAKVNAALAVHLVDTKGLAFGSAEEAAAARAEFEASQAAARTSGEVPQEKAAPAAKASPTVNEEN